MSEGAGAAGRDQAAGHPRGEVLWTPPTDGSAGRQLQAYLEWLRTEHGVELAGYDALHEWSVDELERFWSTFTTWAEVRWHDQPSEVLLGGDRAMGSTSRHVVPTWFPGGTLNYAEQMLAPARSAGDAPALVAHSQTRDRIEVPWSDLVDQVGRCRAGLIALGVQKGDRVVAYAPNIPETLVAFLATASLGAIWASCPPEFGVRSVVDRLAQIQPKVLIAVDGYRYAGKAIDRRTELAAITADLPTVEHLVGIPYLDPDAAVGDVAWTDLLSDAQPMSFEPVPFEHPLYVLFSSGTTGLPKAIVHGHGGITVEHLKQCTLQLDLGPGDQVTWFTTTGWMMWNFVISCLMTGSTVHLLDGDPAYPSLDALWELAATERLRLLGVGAPLIMAQRKAGLRPGDDHDLSALRMVGSTGSPLPAEGFQWVTDAVGAHVQVNSISGGTDVCSAFVGMIPTVEVRAGEIARSLLGCDVQAFDGSSHRVAPGVTGELVITKPMPSMPVGFWGDRTGAKYRAAYFGEHQGVWTHGDWITFFEDGNCVISGRSDATLNRGGVRLGTSDFYTVVEAFPEVADSLVVHLDVPDEPMGELVLFVALAAGSELDDDLRGRIVKALRGELSPRHVPDRIDAVPVVPRTLSGKKLEVPVKRILMGASADRVASKGSLVDPHALDHFEELARQSG